MQIMISLRLISVLDMSVADLHSEILDAPVPGSKFFQLHAVLGKIWLNRMSAPAGGLAPPPQGNSGSATACLHKYCVQ